MKVIIDNHLAKEIVQLLCKKSSIIDDFLFFKKRYSSVDYCITNVSIEGIKKYFQAENDLITCHDTALIDSSSDNIFDFEVLEIQNLAARKLHDHKEEGQLELYLKETYYTSIKKCLKNRYNSQNDELIFIGANQTEKIAELLEDIKTRQFLSFSDFVQFYCNDFKDIDLAWLEVAIQSIDTFELMDKLSVDHTSIEDRINELFQKPEIDFLEEALNKEYKIVDSEIESWEISDNAEEIFTCDIYGNSLVSINIDAKVNFKLFIPASKTFLAEPDFTWDDLLDEKFIKSGELQDVFEIEEHESSFMDGRIQLRHTQTTSMTFKIFRGEIIDFW